MFKPHPEGLPGAIAGKAGNTLIVTEELSAVRLELDCRAESSALVRAALTGLAEVHGLEAELFDDVKTAVTEACNNVSLYAYHGEPGPFVVAFEVSPGAIEATIRDWGTGIQQVAPSEERMGVGLAVISALADRAEFISAPDGGTEVRMAWGNPEVGGAYTATVDGGPGGPLSTYGSASGQMLPPQLTGDVVVTLSPPGLLPGVLPRVARAVAARTQLSLDRFAEIDRVSAALAAVLAASGDEEVTFAAAGRGRRLELTVGPVEPGRLEMVAPAVEPASAPGLVRVVIDE